MSKTAATGDPRRADAREPGPGDAGNGASGNTGRAGGGGQRWDAGELKRLIRLREVVERPSRWHGGSELRRGGAGKWKILCPFHQEVTPSLFIYDDEDRWKCFGCGRGGDIFDFLIHASGGRLGFVEAGDELASWFGVPVPDGTRPGPMAREGACDASPLATRSRREEGGARATGRETPTGDEAEALALAGRWYAELLWCPEEGAAARAYLRHRGIPAWATARLQLGWSDGRTIAGRFAALEEGRLVPAARRVGLLGGGAGTGRPLAETLGGRVIIPEIRAGHAIWMTGRTLAPEPAKGSPARRGYLKYRNIDTAKPLLGLEQVRGQPSVTVVEGTLCWVTLVAWGIAACSPNGAGVNDRALAPLSGAAQILGIFDDDLAGDGAHERLAVAFGSRYRRVRLPSGCDANDLAQRPGGRAAFLALWTRALDAVA